MGRHKRVLITGGHGFVGRNLWNYLGDHRTSWDMTRFRSASYNLCSRDETEALFKSCEPEYVIHLAAKCGGIGANQLNPAEFWASNLQMGINLLDACVSYAVRKFVMLGTVCSYPHTAPLPFRTESLCAGWPEPTNRPYGIAKLSLYEGVRAYNLQYKLPFSFLIPTNMYGPYDHFDLETSHVIPAMIRKFHEATYRDEDEVTLWGDGSPSRDFLFAPDVAEAIALAIEKDTGTEPVNLGSGREISMAALAEAISATVGYRGGIVWDKSRPNGQPRRAVDGARAETLLGWAPSTALLDGLARTYGHYLDSL